MLTWLLQNPPQPCYEYVYGLHVDAMRAQTEAFPAYRDAVSKFAAGELDQASAALTIARPLIDDANNLMARAGGSIATVSAPDGQSSVMVETITMPLSLAFARGEPQRTRRKA